MDNFVLVNSWDCSDYQRIGYQIKRRLRRWSTVGTTMHRLLIYHFMFLKKHYSYCCFRCIAYCRHFYLQKGNERKLNAMRRFFQINEDLHRNNCHFQLSSPFTLNLYLFKEKGYLFDVRIHASSQFISTFSC